jgi:hypothetical protein
MLSIYSSIEKASVFAGQTFIAPAMNSAYGDG